MSSIHIKMAESAQDVIIELILRYIGGSRLSASSKFDVGGQKVAIQATSLEAIAAKLSQYGSTVDQVRTSVLTNPKANTIATTKSNLDAVKNQIMSL